MYILNITMMINQEKGKDKVVKKYKGKGGLEQRVTYIIRIMFMNYRMKKKTKLTHIKHSCFFYRYNLHNYLNSSSHGSPEFPNQNLSLIGLGVSELWSVIQTDKQRLQLYIYRYTVRTLKPWNRKSTFYYFVFDVVS